MNVEALKANKNPVAKEKQASKELEQFYGSASERDNPGSFPPRSRFTRLSVDTPQQTFHQPEGGEWARGC